MTKSELRALYNQIGVELRAKKRIRRRLNTKSSKEYQNLYAFYKFNIMHDNKKYQTSIKKYKQDAFNANQRGSKYINRVSKALMEFGTKEEKAVFETFISTINNL